MIFGIISKCMKFGIISKIIRWALALFFSSTILAVVAYRFIPVYLTPLMLIRCVQQAGSGESIKLHHSWMPLDNMSRHLPVAVMASEDQRFLLHHGFDYDAIVAAAKRNRTGAGRKYGASTISQQTAKNVFLWPGRSWTRKGFEAYFTALIELLWSKHRIMEVYLNSIEMGDGIYGAEAVAQRHFSKSASQLSRAEAAMIAASLPNPLKFDSGNPSAYMRARRGSIEQQMKFIPSFPKEGEDYDPNTTSGGVYHRKR